MYLYLTYQTALHACIQQEGNIEVHAVSPSFKTTTQDIYRTGHALYHSPTPSLHGGHRHHTNTTFEIQSARNDKNHANTNDKRSSFLSNTPRADYLLPPQSTRKSTKQRSASLTSDEFGRTCPERTRSDDAFNNPDVRDVDTRKSLRTALRGRYNTRQRNYTVYQW